MAVPKLRFKEFDADYTNTTFEKLKGFSIQSGKSEEKGDTGEFPFYGSTGVIGYKDIFDYEGKSILIARVGANAGSLYQIDGKYSVSDNTLRLTVSDDTSLDYLRELLIKFNLNRLVFGTGQPLVTGGMIKKVNIFIPEFTEQTKIASFLSNVDEKISQLTQKHELLSQYKQGMMQKLFSQQIRFKADDGSEFGEWVESKITDVADYVDYRGKTPKKVEDGILLVTAKNIRFGYIDYSVSQEYICSDDFDEVMRRGRAEIGDVLITTEAPLGNVASVDRENIALAQRVIKYRGKKGILNNEFLKQKFLSEEFQSLISSKATGGTVQGIKGSTLHNLEIHIPEDIEEQTKIANFLSAIDQKIEVVAQQIEQAKTWKKGLLQQMFV